MRICLVTTGHPSTNPRLVKEADALAGAGCRVRVVACKFARWADEADREFAGRPWQVDWVRFGEMASPRTREWLRVRRATATRLLSITGLVEPVATRALHYVVPELESRAAREPADLFIAHNLAALPAASRSARRHGALVGFDAEDFHRGEYAENEQSSSAYRLTCWAESHYIPRCDYVTAASDGIANAYADVLSIEPPQTIYNVFPLSARDVALDADAHSAEKTPGTCSLYWFSQTIGPGRGLEDVLEALPHLDSRFVLSLRGRWDERFRAALDTRANALGVRDRVRWLPPAPPGEMIARAACHDIGLALEQPRTKNRDVCVTNKIFTYVLAGLPTLATNTTGQRIVCEKIAAATRMVAPGDAGELARSVLDLSAQSAAAREAAMEASQRLNWDLEQKRFLEIVSDTLTRARTSPAYRTSPATP